MKDDEIEWIPGPEDPEREFKFADWLRYCDEVTANMYGFYPLMPKPKRPRCPPPPAAAYAGFAVGEITSYNTQIHTLGFALIKPGSTTRVDDWCWSSSKADWEPCGEAVLLMDSARVTIRSYEAHYNAPTPEPEVGQKPDAPKTEGDKLYEFFHPPGSNSWYGDE